MKVSFSSVCLFASLSLLAPCLSQADDSGRPDADRSNEPKTRVALGGEGTASTNGQVGGRGVFSLEVPARASRTLIGANGEMKLRLDLKGGASASQSGDVRPLIQAGLEISESGRKLDKVSGVYGDPALVQVNHDHTEVNYLMPGVGGGGAIILPNGVQFAPNDKNTISVIPVLGIFNDYASHMTDAGAQVAARVWSRHQLSEKLRLDAQVKPGATFGGGNKDSHQVGVGFNLTGELTARYNLGQHLSAEAGMSIYDNISNIRKADGSVELQNHANLTATAGIAGVF